MQRARRPSRRPRRVHASRGVRGGGLRPVAWLALATLLALGASESSRLLHLALVPHSRCEHGELVHVEHARRSASAAAAARSPGADERAVEQAGRFERDHQHCDAAVAQQACLPEPPRPVVTALLTWLAAPDAIGPHAASPAIAQLLLAPKQSPPTG